MISSDNSRVRHPKFTKATGIEFSKTLRKRINSHFKEKGISKHANKSMVAKTILMLSLFFVPLITIGLGLIESTFLLFALYIVSGIGMAGIGMGIMHDAIHGSYSKNRKINKLLGYTFNLIGANATVWQIQHNQLHHTYTNIEDADDDLNAPFFLRFSPHAKKYWSHQFQHIYIWIFYCLSTISWVTTKDFVRIKRYHGMGFLKGKNEFRNALIEMVGWKLFYYSYALIIPLIVAPQAWWVVLLAFLGMHAVTGLLISTVFQVAHIIPSAEFPLPDENGIIAGDWYTHQFATTSNFSPKSRLFSWLIGGLNYQIEHHLLPNVCHIHYKDISKIVVDTAEEFGMPYYSKKTFASAIWSHTKMLKQLGTA
ncbi:MAG: acyl-CoA desaturase [Flavobacteriaceae bacterium]|nr:acyl-CoA desaturase [Flavobacteriaceae bacterium]